ncbi:MAG: RluA family pseudouridine synthase [Deferribacteraceae bacterium]|jgi:23S rRNA pseudouridine1911/1915/1917 synthase|nr:RluA family pseudouridine synthase [Deferribacteraceae bacterium]
MSDDKRLVATESAKRLDQYLADNLSRSRSYFSTLIDDGHVLLNGNTPKKSDKVKVGDVINIHFPKEELPDITPREVAFDIVYDTPRYAIINKPAGIAVHPAPGHYDDSLVNGLLYAFSIKDEAADLRPGIVHRLDKDTSGLLIVAKDGEAREKLSRLFHDRLVDKYYLAVAYGVPKFKTITIEAPIGRDKKHRQRMAVTDDGRQAKTVVTVRELYNKAFLADVKLFTGRTHQIRVHMKHVGHSLLGDELYGGATLGKLFDRQALHAYRVAFIDPFTNEPIDISIDLPEDMKELIERIR